MNFLLTPPIVTHRGFGFSLLHVGHMELPEILIIRMSGWSTLDILRHWRSEIGHLLDGSRNCCCIVSGLTRVSDSVVIPSEWWKVFLVDAEARFHNQVLKMPDLIDSAGWLSPDDWWRNIQDYSPWSSSGDNERRHVSEWVTPINALSAWCTQCDILLTAIESE